ncbi:MAG TPA: chromate transporter [Trichormus sp.]
MSEPTAVTSGDESGAERLAEDSSASALMPLNGSGAATLTPPAADVIQASLGEIFQVFLLIGAISFGGGVVAYLRSYLVTNKKWLNDESFIELLAISQSLPGLNATNMAVLIGDRLQGKTGSAVAMLGICLPGAAMMLAAGAMYKLLHHNYFVQCVLHSVAAAAIGLVLATTLQLGKKSVKIPWDWVILVLCVIGINLLHQMVPFVLLAVGFLSIQPHMPRKNSRNDIICLVIGIIVAVGGFCNWIQLPAGKASAVHDFWYEARLYLEASRPIGWIGVLIVLRSIFDLGVLKPRPKQAAPGGTA